MRNRIASVSSLYFGGCKYSDGSVLTKNKRALASYVMLYVRRSDYDSALLYFIYFFDYLTYNLWQR